MTQHSRRTLLDTLSRGIAYSVPAFAVLVGGSAVHAIYSDLATPSGYYMFASAEASPEAEAGPEAEASPEAEAEAEAGAEAGPEAEANPEAEAEAEASSEAG
ncbi:hypothetical protein ACRHM7_07230 [Chromohalobacter israelensis]|uniref:hypothetical protein n=1 Tax=Chromohalobacter israelensis TaxID=141390 RepID=UPI000D7185B2|nr:hypothetical protein [Chromohalobacter salexigens]PWW33827.1 hypothetical protein DFO74_12323 [Chromohalobacter salexigens]